jgi:hypothetical protein
MSLFEECPVFVDHLRHIYAFNFLNFSSIVFLYSPCDCNNDAHALAAIGASQRGSCLVALPNSIMVLVTKDLTKFII